MSLWVENLPEECDLINFEVHVGGARGTLTYIGPKEYDGMAQVNLRLPLEVGTGLQPVVLKWRGEEIGPAAKVRIVPQPALVPRVLALSDGINLMSGPRIETRSVKVTLEEVVGAVKKYFQHAVIATSAPAASEEKPAGAAGEK